MTRKVGSPREPVFDVVANESDGGRLHSSAGVFHVAQNLGALIASAAGVFEDPDITRLARAIVAVDD